MRNPKLHQIARGLGLAIPYDAAGLAALDATRAKPASAAKPAPAKGKATKARR